jgi:hypothetical protein
MDTRGRVDHGSVGGSIWAPSADGSVRSGSAASISEGGLASGYGAVTERGDAVATRFGLNPEHVHVAKLASADN